MQHGNFPNYVWHANIEIGFACMVNCLTYMASIYMNGESAL